MAAGEEFGELVGKALASSTDIAVPASWFVSGRCAKGSVWNRCQPASNDIYHVARSEGHEFGAVQIEILDLAARCEERLKLRKVPVELQVAPRRHSNFAPVPIPAEVGFALLIGMQVEPR